MNLFIFSIFVALPAVLKASHPYYYIGQPAFYQLPSVPTYNSFGQPFTSTYFVNPHFQYRTVPSPIIPQIPAPIPAPINPPTNNRQVYNQNDDSEYRGFGYHTRNDNGATSHVLFVTGPQSQTFRSSIFSNVNQQNTVQIPTQKENVDKARNGASDMVDTVNNKETVTENTLPRNIQDIYAPPEINIQNDALSFLRNFMQGSENSIFNIYSKNSDLFARPVAGYPASTFPLIDRRFSTPFVTSRFNVGTSTETTQTTTEKDSETISTTTENDKKSEAEIAQESVITNTRFRINELIDQVEKLTSEETTSVAPTTISASMTPIVVEETTINSSMAPIVVDETTSTTTTTTTELTTSTSTTEVPSTSTTESVKEETSSENPTTSEITETELVKESLVSLINKDNTEELSTATADITSSTENEVKESSTSITIPTTEEIESKETITTENNKNEKMPEEITTDNMMATTALTDDIK